jgi:signal transduction histidine kinase
VELESAGLVQALIELAGTVEKLFKISCRFEGDGMITLHDRHLGNHLFRIAQEAINNSVKHGKARQVVIDLRRSSDKTVLVIRDDGVGFPAQGLKTNGLGLRIMHYRAQRIGGVLEIRPTDNGGTMVSCSFHNTNEVL